VGPNPFSDSKFGIGIYTKPLCTGVVDGSGGGVSTSCDEINERVDAVMASPLYDELAVVRTNDKGVEYGGLSWQDFSADDPETCDEAYERVIRKRYGHYRSPANSAKTILCDYIYINFGATAAVRTTKFCEWKDGQCSMSDAAAVSTPTCKRDVDEDTLPIICRTYPHLDATCCGEDRFSSDLYCRCGLFSSEGLTITAGASAGQFVSPAPECATLV